MLGLLLGAALALQAPATPPPPADVMAVPDGLRAAFREQVDTVTGTGEQKLERLLRFIVGEDRLAIRYRDDATHTVAETWATREGNCLSFTLMAVALAREAGWQAEGQRIDRVLSWNASGEVFMQNMHANAVVTIRNRRFVFDIAANRIAAASAPYIVDDRHLLALYYNNRAMELLAGDRPDAAGAWLELAIGMAPDDAVLWNNAGVLGLREQGGDGRAEALFRKALALEPRLDSGLYNLAALYRRRGDSRQAAYWKSRADAVLQDAPYYHFSLGLQRERHGDYAAAATLYRRAVALDGDEDLFHFGLARAYYRMGDLRRAQRELDAASRLAEGGDRARYRAKLGALERLSH